MMIEKGNILVDDDYTLRADCDGCWITVGNLSVRIAKTDEGVAVDLYSLGHEDENAIASTYAYFAEAEEPAP